MKWLQILKVTVAVSTKVALFVYSISVYVAVCSIEGVVINVVVGPSRCRASSVRGFCDIR